MAKVPYGIETLPKISIAWVGCTNVTDRRQTDGRTMTYSERELEFTFAKNYTTPVSSPLGQEMEWAYSFYLASSVWGQAVRRNVREMPGGECPEWNNWRKCPVPVQDYKSLCAVFMICATLVNTQTHMQTNSYWLGYLLLRRMAAGHTAVQKAIYTAIQKF